MMIHSKWGYGSEAIGYLRVSLRNRWPVAYEAFESYNTPAVSRSISVLRKKYPLAYAVFQEELRV